MKQKSQSPVELGYERDVGKFVRAQYGLLVIQNIKNREEVKRISPKTVYRYIAQPMKEAEQSGYA